MTIDQHALLRSASRTFALSIERLPGVVGDAMCLAYLLLRVSDFLADNDYLPPERKVALLKLWDSVLAGDEPAEKLVAQLADHAPGDDPAAQVAALADEVRAKDHPQPQAARNQMLWY